MKKTVGILITLLLSLCLCVPAFSYGYDEMTLEDYELFYEIAKYLCDDWESEYDDLIDELADYYGVTMMEVYDFIEFAMESDRDHVWIPVNGGKKYHAVPECSKMVDPRPATKDMAYDYGFTPCGRCKPGV